MAAGGSQTEDSTPLPSAVQNWGGWRCLAVTTSPMRRSLMSCHCAQTWNTWMCQVTGNISIGVPLILKSSCWSTPRPYTCTAFPFCIVFRSRNACQCPNKVLGREAPLESQHHRCQQYPLSGQASSHGDKLTEMAHSNSRSTFHRFLHKAALQETTLQSVLHHTLRASYFSKICFIVFIDV